MSKETYPQLVAREFKRMKRLADGAMTQISDEQFFAFKRMKRLADGAMTQISDEQFCAFKRMKRLADGAMTQISDEQFFAVPSVGDNSVAIIVKHVGGNLISRWTDFLTSDGEKPGRNRDTEFAILTDDTRENLIRQWEEGWAK